MTENLDFEIVPTARGRLDNKIQQDAAGVDKLAVAAADNFDRILDIAATIVDIQKMQVQADACICMLHEQRMMLKEEAEAYVKKLQAETSATINKAEAIRKMMNDYYYSGYDKLSGDEFSAIISNILDHMGAL